MAKRTKSKYDPAKDFPQLLWKDGIVIRITRGGSYYGAYFNRHPMYYNTAVFPSLDMALYHLLSNKDYWNNDMKHLLDKSIEEKLIYLHNYFMEHDDGHLEIIKQEFKYL